MRHYFRGTKEECDAIIAIANKAMRYPHDAINVGGGRWAAPEESRTTTIGTPIEAKDGTFAVGIDGVAEKAADAAKETETPFGKQPPLITKGEESTLITQIGKAVPMPKDWEAPTATEAKPAAEAERDR